MVKTAQQVLSHYYGYPSFRENQQEVIDTLLAGKDAFVLMPTGSGKSICYQIPSIMLNGVGLVVSPLIALMQDQVEALRQNGVRAAFLNSSLSLEEFKQVEGRVLNGQCDILYVAPERLFTERFQKIFGKIPVALFAIDEAHCVSQWGHDFRPEYLRLVEVMGRFPGVPRIALTATADSTTRKDIVEKLDLADASQFISSFDRPNINYQVKLKANGKKQLLDFIQNDHFSEAGIVYTRTRKRADEMARWLQEKGVNGLPYHAGMDAHTRQLHQHRFLREDAIVIVATIAFGMGIDKPDVRFVAHLDLPSSMEAYYQETGRSGRDGQPADAWMVYSLGDVVAMRRLLETSDGDAGFKRIQQQKLEALFGYCESAGCRRQMLLGYFGEAYPDPCGNCDTCSQEIEVWDGSIAAQKVLSCVYRTGQRFGAVHLTDVLIGNRTERVQRLKHDRLKTFGVGDDLSQTEWRSVFRQLLAGGFLSVDIGKISGFRLTEKSWPVLKGTQQVQLRKDPHPIKSKKSVRPSSPTVLEFENEQEMQLFEKLRLLRLEIARKLGLPPYVVFHDKTLKEMAILKPQSRTAMLQVTGIGEVKLERYGERFLDVIKETKG
ncbi:MAG: DNA helicase RecQ [Deltaproteobacteria bacterium]|jgi:ATP-dependent DNA helicase RecQ|nr:DNA helicase RecQ [Deltaproteobacteria bacterium]MBW2670818.1 DNA helicase RecQ [Deltaproteobacteria bacterium]